MKLFNFFLGKLKKSKDFYMLHHQTVINMLIVIEYNKQHSNTLLQVSKTGSWILTKFREYRETRTKNYKLWLTEQLGSTIKN